MAKNGKQLRNAYADLKKENKDSFSVSEAVKLVKKMAHAKFDESVEMAFHLGIDPKQPDQQLRGFMQLPHGTGKKIRVVVFAKGDAADLAKKAGAEKVGAEDLIEEINNGFLAFDRAVASPDLMAKVAKLGPKLGPKGLMPNPKLGTVTQDVAGAVEKLKAGSIEYRSDKNGGIHVGVGKVSFSEPQLIENIQALIKELHTVKPKTIKGTFIKKIAISSSMGPGISLDLSANV